MNTKEYLRLHKDEVKEYHRIRRITEKDKLAKQASERYKKRKTRLQKYGKTIYSTLSKEQKIILRVLARKHSRYGKGVFDSNSQRQYTNKECELIVTGMRDGKKLKIKEIAMLLGRTVAAITSQRVALRKEYYREI